MLRAPHVITPVRGRSAGSRAYHRRRWGSSALLVAGCGSHERSLSKAEYIERADAICHGLASALTTNSWKTVQQITIASNESDVWRRALEKLRALKAPKADRDTVAKIWDEEEAAFVRWDAELKTGKLVKTFDDEPGIFGRVAADTHAYGIEGCGT
jgi:hypothetical protein